MQSVRVFVSSTFVDMHAERDVLSKVVFPQLRARFRPAGIDIAEIDLRWGITSEDAAESRVLPICLNEIDHCRPFFLALIGDRRGWSDPTSRATLSRSYPHLLPYADRSITELEIRQAVLNSPEGLGPCEGFFYFRKSAQAGSADEQAIQPLRDEITARAPGRARHYSTPQELGALVLADLGKQMETLCRADTQDPGAAAPSRELVATYGMGALPREALIEQLRKITAKNGARVLVYGAPGVGKTTLLTHFAQRRIREGKAGGDTRSLGRRLLAAFGANAVAQTTQQRIVFCARSAMGRALDWRTPVREIVAQFASQSPPSMAAEDLLSHASELLTQANPKPLLMVDGLDELEPEQGSGLTWLAQLLRSGITTVVGCRSPALRAVLERMGFSVLEVPPFAPAEAVEACHCYFSRYGKRLSEEQAARLADGVHAAGLLRMKQDELRLFGNYERLDEEIDRIARLESLEQMVTAIVQRVRNDQAIEAAPASDALLAALCNVRTGLSDRELLALLQELGFDMTQRHLSELLHAYAPLLTIREGSITVASTLVRDALMAQFGEAHVDGLVTYLLDNPASWRSMVELPHLLARRRDWGRLCGYLCDASVVSRMFEEIPSELDVFVRLLALHAESALHERLDMLMRSGRLAWPAAKAVAHMAAALGQPALATALIEDQVSQDVRAAADINGLRMLVASLGAQQRHAEAVDAIMRCRRAMGEAVDSKEWAFTAICLADLWLEQGCFDNAAVELESASAHLASHQESQDLKSALRLAQAHWLLLTDELAESEKLYSEALAQSERHGDLAAQHAILGNLGVIARLRERPKEALRRHESEESLCRSLGDFRALHVCLGNQALAHFRLGNLDKAVQLFETKVALAQQCSDTGGEIDAMTGLANVYDALGQASVAKRLRDRSVVLAERKNVA